MLYVYSYACFKLPYAYIHVPHCVVCSMYHCLCYMILIQLIMSAYSLSALTMQFLDYLTRQPLVIELWGSQSDKDEALGHVRAPSERGMNERADTDCDMS